MSQFFFENPVALGVTGIALTLVAVLTWIKSGHRAALIASAALLILTLLLVSLNLQIRTDREKVQAVITDVAAAVQRNDLDEVLRHVHGSTAAVVHRAKTELPSFKFTEARITGIKKIEVNPNTTPPSAVAEFNVAVSVSGHGQEFNGVRRFVRCNFLREGDRWLVSDYEHFEPTQGFRAEP